MAPKPTTSAQRNTLRRDAAIERLRRSTTWLSAAALALVGVFSAAVATTLPGHRAASPQPATPAPTTPVPATTVPSAPPATSAGAPGQLQPPAAPPTAPPATAPPATAPPVTAPPVVSGAS